MRFRDSLWFKIAVLVVILLVWLLWVAPSSCSVKVGSSAKGETLELDRASDLVIDTTHNNISVVRSSGVSKITATATGSGRSFDEVTSSRSGDTLKISMDVQNKWWQFWKIGLRARRLEVQIPEDMAIDNLTVSSVSGSVEVAEMVASDLIKVKSISGSVDVDPVSAPRVEISSTSGSVDVASVTADTAEVSSVSGHVELGWFAGDSIELSSTSGSVDLYDSGNFKSLKLSSVSGSIDAEFNAVSPKVKASSLSGSVEVNNQDFGHGVDIDGTGAVVEARTTSGSIELKY